MKAARYSLLLLMLSVLGLVLPAQAQPGQGGGRFLRERPANAQRQVPPRRDEADGQRILDERAADEDRRRELTPEERRQLRRDIHDAGRDIYRPERMKQRMRDRMQERRQ
jgi:hypothetical protein